MLRIAKLSWQRANNWLNIMSGVLFKVDSASNQIKVSSRKKFTNKFGESKMHIMKECLFPFGISYALQKNSPYTAK